MPVQNGSKWGRGASRPLQSRVHENHPEDRKPNYTCEFAFYSCVYGSVLNFYQFENDESSQLLHAELIISSTHPLLRSLPVLLTGTLLLLSCFGAVRLGGSRSLGQPESSHKKTNLAVLKF